MGVLFCEAHRSHAQACTCLHLRLSKQVRQVRHCSVAEGWHRGKGCVLIGAPASPVDSGQDHIWAPMAFESLGAANPSFHRIQIRSTETSRGTKSTISILEEVDALCPTYCKQQTCVCCLDDFKCQDKVSLLPCGHVLHESCLVDWHVLKKCGHAACPICRDSWASV